jgi:hypothetical protein
MGSCEAPSFAAVIAAKFPAVKRPEPLPRFLEADPHIGVINLEISDADIMEAAKITNRSSAPGLSGALQDFLLLFATSPHSNDMTARDCRKALLRFLNRVWTTAAVPDNFRIFFQSGRIIPLTKEDLSPRPVVCCEAFSRIFTRIENIALRKHAAPSLAPQQLGVGVPNGVGILAQAMRTALEISDSLAIGKTDISNAFNTPCRWYQLHVFRQWCPPLVNPTLRQYSQNPFAAYAKADAPIHPYQATKIKWVRIPIQCGSMMGCPLAALQFALTYHHTQYNCNMLALHTHLPSLQQPIPFPPQPRAQYRSSSKSRSA